MPPLLNLLLTSGASAKRFLGLSLQKVLEFSAVGDTEE